MDKRLFLSAPHMSGKELEYVQDVFKSNYIAPLGAYVDAFEQSIQGYTKAKHALALSSGTAAIHLALRVLGVQEGDDVLASTLTFIGSINAILYQGANPIFIDSDSASWNLSPVLLEEYLQTCHKKPKALILTHLYGQCAHLEEIVKICQKYEIFLIEDAAESLGATYQQRQTGTFGDFGIYSFNGNKIITTSGGGMLVSPHREWIEKAKFYSTQAREKTVHYEHKEYGYNYRMSNVLAAIGVAQMEILDERIAQKRQIFHWYQKHLSHRSDIVWMPELLGTRGNRWLSTFVCANMNVNRVIEALEKANIESRPLWKPMHLQPLFQQATSYIDGTSESLFKRGLCLPSSTIMGEEDVFKVCKIVQTCLPC